MELPAILQVVSITVGISTITSLLLGRTFPWMRSKLQSRDAHRRLKGVLTREQIESSVRYYVRPRCQDLDPAGADEPRLIVGVQQDLFPFLDRVFTHPTEFRYLFILADSGMGKTVALINYYVRHLRRWRKRYEVEYVPLGNSDADERINAIQDKENTILLLDAFDEDVLAIVDHAERLRLIAKNTRKFMRVVVTCRTQFFARDEEIPQRTGVIKIAARAAGEEAEYLFHKIYLSPFSDEDVDRYISRRYPLWRWSARTKAKHLVKKIPYLSVRPMLLAHIDDIVQSRPEIRYAFELYEEMVKAWIHREKGFISDSESLRRFSGEIALDIFRNREARRGERISRLELEDLAQSKNIQLDGWILTGRSLLNRDAEGNYKFAHRSIMEYLIAAQFLKEASYSTQFVWTDQIMEFMGEMAEAYVDAFMVSSVIYSLSKGRRDTLLSWMKYNATRDLETWAIRLVTIVSHLHRTALLSIIEAKEDSQQNHYVHEIRSSRAYESVYSADDRNRMLSNKLGTFLGKVSLEAPVGDVLSIDDSFGSHILVIKVAHTPAYFFACIMSGARISLLEEEFLIQVVKSSTRPNNN